mmetsp:Transcript_33468/g.105432  ORF Transcript_33468/g.105432 Transcript_33468/m.105432 type:complete len:941 (-) Transcript_33468:53-2875(-)
MFSQDEDHENQCSIDAETYLDGENKDMFSSSSSDFEEDPGAYRNDQDASGTAVNLQGTGHDIARHLLPSRPGPGHTVYSDWKTEEYDPKLYRLNIIDYFHDVEGRSRPYVEDQEYEGSNIRAQDYWNLKRIARQIKKGFQSTDSNFCRYYQKENLAKIEQLVPSRQVKFEAGARIRRSLSLYAWRYRRRKAAIKIQATYRMHLVKFVVQKERAERRQRNMELNAREELAREREEKKTAASRRKTRGTASRGKTVEMKERKETATSDSAGSIESRAITNKGVTFETMDMEDKDELKHEDAEGMKTEMLSFTNTGSNLEAEILVLQYEDESEEEGTEQSETSSSSSTDSEDDEYKEELKRIKTLLKQNGMSRVDISPLLALVRRSKEEDAKFSAIEQSKLEMVRTILQADDKMRDKCAAFVQAFWRGKMQRRAFEEERRQQKLQAKLRRDHCMATNIARTFRGHIARRLFRYSLLHAQRNERISRVLENERLVRKVIQEKLAALRRQLSIAVKHVQRVFRGHLGRRRMVAQRRFAWELLLHSAARRIQRMYRDYVDRQWAAYVGKGNLQVLVGSRAAAVMRIRRQRRAGEQGGSYTLKPPLASFYHKDVVNSASNLEDGVPARVLPQQAPLLRIPPSMPASERLRKRWGMKEEAVLDSTARVLSLASAKLESLRDFQGGDDDDDEEEEEQEEEGKPLRNTMGEHASFNVLTGTEAYTGREDVANGRGRRPDEGKQAEEGDKVGADVMEDHGREEEGAAREGQEEVEDGRLLEARRYREEMARGEALFGTELERFHVAPGQAQIMPNYLRLQFRESAERSRRKKLAALGDLEGARQVRKSELARGSILHLARARDEVYTSRGMRKVGGGGLPMWDQVMEDEEEVEDLEAIMGRREKDRQMRWRKLKIGAPSMSQTVKSRELDVLRKGRGSERKEASRLIRTIR